MRIAIVQGTNSFADCCAEGAQSEGCEDAMSQVLVWCMEAGEIPLRCSWVTVELPPIPTPDELSALAEAGQFPKSFVDDLNAA